MMNREKLDSLPKMQVSKCLLTSNLIFKCIVIRNFSFKSSFSQQVGFIDAICLPIYESFSVYSEDRLQPLLDGCLENKQQWLKLSEQEKFDAWEDESDMEADNC